MNWLEKVKELKKQRSANIFIDARFRENLWEVDEIIRLKQKLPFLPEMYTKFIEEFDSCGIGFTVFFGSRKSKIISIEKQIEEHKEILKNDYFPFGKYPDGSVFLLNQKGEVLWWDKYDYDFEKPKFIAASFDEFMNECLLGKRYGEFSFVETSTFYKTLQAQGWV